MPDKLQIPRDATFARERLDEVIKGMVSIWRKSIDEAGSNNPIDLYVVDTDVVKMFMEPRMTSFYGALLRYDGFARSDEGSNLKDLEKRLVEFLGNFIFYQLRPTVPLLLLPTHADELDRQLNSVYDNVARDLGNWEQVITEISKSAATLTETSKTQFAQADEAQAAAGNSNKEQTVDDLLNEILSSLLGKGAVGELFRFDALVSGGRICHIDRMSLQDKDGRTRFLPPPLNEKGKYIPSVSRLADRLEKAMLRITNPDDKKREYTINADAQALAHFVWLNEILKNEEWFVDIGDNTPRKVRQLILITGAHRLPKAATELELKELRDCIAAPVSFLGHRLMDEYFRSSSSYESIKEVANQGLQVSALINFFASMRDVLKSALMTREKEKIFDAIKDVYEKQSKLIDSWRRRQLLGEHSQMKAVTEAIRHLEDSGQSLDGLKLFLENLSVMAWQRFARSVMMLNLKAPAIDNAVQRNIPPVRFGYFTHAERISGRLYSIGDSATARECAMNILNEGAIRELEREDPTRYTEFVCYALFGLVHRSIRSAQGCAAIAWSIAHGKPRNNPLDKHIKGEEALYLLAHIIRLKAHDKKELERAEYFINIACQTTKDDSSTYGDDIRLQAERFSIRCHQYYFDYFGPVENWTPNLPNERDSNKLKLLVIEGKGLLAKLKEDFGTEERKYLFEYVKQQLLVNLAQVSLLGLVPAKRMGDEKIEVKLDLTQDFDNYTIGIESIIKELIEQCIYLQEDQTETLPKASILAKSVAAVSNLVFLKKESGQDLDNWCRFDDGRVASIDDLRFSYLAGVYKLYSKS